MPLENLVESLFHVGVNGLYKYFGYRISKAEIGLRFVFLEFDFSLESIDSFVMNVFN